MKRRTLAALVTLAALALAGSSIALAEGGRGGGGMMGGGFGGGPGMMGGGFMGGGGHGMMGAGMMGGGFGHGPFAGLLNTDKLALAGTIQRAEHTATLAKAIAGEVTRSQLKSYADDLAGSATADATAAKALYKKLYGKDAPTLKTVTGTGVPPLLAFAKDTDKVATLLLYQHAKQGQRQATALAAEVDNDEVAALLTAAGKAAKANATKLAGWYEDWYGTAVPTFGHA